MPEDSFLAGGVTEKVALNGSVLASIHVGGAGGTRTPYLLNAIEALSRLSYSPTYAFNIAKGRTDCNGSDPSTSLRAEALEAKVSRRAGFGCHSW